jgi:hypothetical protein
MTWYQIVFYDSDGCAAYHTLAANGSGSAEGAMCAALDRQTIGEHPERIQPLICNPIYLH